MSKNLLLATLVVFSISFSRAAPLSTAITYQGSLSDGGSLAVGTYDFEFRLWNASSGGAQVAPLVFLDDVEVVLGVFSVSLDFGDTPFVGDDLWLEIAVREGASVGGFQGLLPRQALTPAPFALHAEFVPENSITNLEIDTASVQARVSSSCTLGMYIRAIDASGAVTCEVDEDTIIEAGNGLRRSGTTFSVDSSVTQLRVNGACPANETIRSIAADGSVTCDVDDLGLTSVTSADIVDDAVGSAQIATNAVGSSEIADGAVGAVDINSSQVQTRISGSCSSGTYLSGISQNGSVSCSVLPVGLAYTADPNGSAGMHTSIAIRDDGRPIISYYDASVSGLGVFSCSNAVCSGGTAVNWDIAGDTGSYTSIAIRDDGLPIIAYFDASNGMLKVLDCLTLNCTSSATAYTLASGGAGTSIAIRDNGRPIIAFYQSGAGLRIFDCSTTSCAGGTAYTADAGGLLGRYPSIAIRNDGLPVVSYFDNINNDVKLYDCSNTACSSGTAYSLDGAGSVGAYSSIAIRDNGRPIISYYDFGSGNLKLFSCASTSCSGGQEKTLDSLGIVGEYASIAIANGLPIISYYYNSTANLRVFQCTDMFCNEGNVRTLDSAGQVGQYTDIAIRPGGLPIISYYDEGLADLKVFSCGDSRCEN